MRGCREEDKSTAFEPHRSDHALDRESEALRGLKAGDSRGLATLVDIHQSHALRFAYTLTGNLEMAEDVVADAFLTVYERISQFDDKRPFGPWFYRIVVNTALKTQRTAARSRQREARMVALRNQTTSDLSLEAGVIQQETQRMVMAAINELPAPQRVVLALRYYLELEEGAIAGIVGCPVGTVKWRLHQARKSLRRRVTQEHIDGVSKTKGEIG